MQGERSFFRRVDIGMVFSPHALHVCVDRKSTGPRSPFHIQDIDKVFLLYEFACELQDLLNGCTFSRIFHIYAAFPQYAIVDAQ